MEIVYNLLLAFGLFLFAYLVGAIPNAVIVGKIFYSKNPLEFGSKNSGGTNAGRVLGRKAGVAVITLDILKTVLVFYVVFAILNFTGLKEAFQIWDEGRFYQWLALAFASLGHCFSPYLKGKGGKAVATLYGAAGGTSWLLFPLCFLLFGLFFKLTKKVMSLASILTGATLVALEWVLVLLNAFAPWNLPKDFFAWSFGACPALAIGWEAGLALTIVYLLLVLRHLPNIQRLRKGEEKSLEWKK